MISEFEQNQSREFAFQLLTAARGDADAKTPVFERSDYDACTVEYIEQGRGFLEINGFSCTPGPDSIYILAKHSTHRYSPDRGDPWKKLFFVADGELMEYLFRIYGLTETYYVPGCPHLKEFFLEMFQLPVNTEEGNRRGALVFHNFLSELSLCVRRPPWRSNPELDRLKNVLDSSVNRSFHLADYARGTPWSEAHLIRLFRSEFKQTPYEYLMSRKIEQARKLLLYSSFSIKEIAEHLAFSDQYYFSNYFKFRCGISPKKFRESFPGELKKRESRIQ